MYYVPGEDLVDIREVHLETVLCFVDGLGHVFESARLEQLVGGFLVDDQVPERRCILVEL